MLLGSLVGWDAESNPFGAGYLRLIQDGTSVVLEVDLDGSGEDYGYQAMVIFENTSVNDFSADNFVIDLESLQGYEPDGSGVFGDILTEVTKTMF